MLRRGVGGGREFMGSERVVVCCWCFDMESRWDEFMNFHVPLT